MGFPAAQGPGALSAPVAGSRASSVIAPPAAPPIVDPTYARVLEVNVSVRTSSPISGVWAQPSAEGVCCRHPLGPEISPSDPSGPRVNPATASVLVADAAT